MPAVRSRGALGADLDPIPNPIRLRSPELKSMSLDGSFVYSSSSGNNNNHYNHCSGKQTDTERMASKTEATLKRSHESKCTQVEPNGKPPCGLHFCRALGERFYILHALINNSRFGAAGRRRSPPGCFGVALRRPSGIPNAICASKANEIEASRPIERRCHC